MLIDASGRAAWSWCDLGRWRRHNEMVGDVLCPVVVGRKDQLAVLDAALAQVLDGAGQLVCLTGEPGIGKSRLARELARQGLGRGAAAVTGRAVPAGASTPYRPLTEALQQALRDRPLPADADLTPWLPPLTAIVPALAGPGHAGTPAAIGGEPSAVIRGEAVVRLLRRLSRPGGLVIVLEDLHWADPDTLAVTEYLADNLAAEPVLCLATSRDEPPSAGLEMIRRLHGRRAAAHLHLGRLTGDQVTAMVRSCLPDAGDDVVARVQRTADGVPFLVEEVLAAPGVPASFRGHGAGPAGRVRRGRTSGAGGRHGAGAPFRLAAAHSHQWAAARDRVAGPGPRSGTAPAHRGRG
jgi:predicted ATPase